MNTIKIYLAESGRIADLRKDFPLYKGQFNDKLLNAYVPTSILAPQFNIQHYIGQMTGAEAPTDEELDAFVEANTYPSRSTTAGDIIEFYNSETQKFFVYQYSTEWTSTETTSFGTFNNLAGTSVKIGMIALKRNGAIYESKSYFMRYIKTLTYQNVEYALYERKLPKEFTTFVGQGQNAPTLIANVVNVDTENTKVLSIITSQTCQLDVMESTMLDQDEPIEASDFELLEAQVNTNAANIADKQDSVDDRLNTSKKAVVGAINDIYGQVLTNTSNIETNAGDISDIKTEQETQNSNIETNTSNIETNTSNITDLQERVSELESTVVTGETYIGTLSGASLPSDDTLDAFVLRVAERQPKGGDYIYFILEIEGQTDKNYKYSYSSLSGWSYAEIPATETANNTTFGIIKGNYNGGNSTPVQLNISGGEFQGLYVVDRNSTLRDIREYLNTNDNRLSQNIEKTNTNEQNINTNANNVSTLQSQMTNILNGNTAVGKAYSADTDGNGRNIVNTYLTQNAGATKQQLYEYALPRTFNDVSFIGANNEFIENLPTSPLAIYTLTTSAVGDFELFYVVKDIVSKTFQLANKNSYTDNLFVTASADCTVTFRLTTEVYVNNEWVTANVELTEPIVMLGGEIKKVVFGSTLNSLDSVLTLANGNKIRQTVNVQTQTSSSITFNVYSNETYPSTFYLNTTAQTIVVSQGMIGELPFFNLTGEIDNNELIFEIPQSATLSNRTLGFFIVSYANAIPANTVVKFRQGNQDIRIVNLYNIDDVNDATIEELKQVYTEGVGFLFNGFIAVENDDIAIFVMEENLSTLTTRISTLESTVVTQQGQIDTKVDFSQAQTLTEEQKAQARSNIGAGASNATVVLVNNVAQPIVSFNSDPQTQINGKQATIDANNKLSADLVDDTNTTNKFVTTSEKNTWNGKQNALSQTQLDAVNSGIDATKVGKIATNESDIDAIEAKIPSAATSSNQLADKAFVNSSVQTATANFRGNWATWADVPTNVNDYPEDYAQSKTPTVNDYLVVQDASGYTGQTLTGTWRFKYSGTWATNGKNGWLPEYQVNEEPLTSAQLNAINSGIDSTKVSQIATNTNDIGTNAQAISNLNSNKVDKVSTNNKLYGTDGSGNQTTYDMGNSANNVAKYDANGKLQSATPTASTDVANKDYVDTADATKQPKFEQDNGVLNGRSSGSYTISELNDGFYIIGTPYGTSTSVNIRPYSSHSAIAFYEGETILIKSTSVFNERALYCIRGETVIILYCSSDGTSGGITSIQTTRDKVNAIDVNSTNAEYPSAKAVYDLFAGVLSNFPTEWTAATRNSTYVNSGDCLYVKIGKVVIARFADVTFKNVNQPHNAVIFSGLPRGTGYWCPFNITCWGGTHFTARFLATDAGDVTNYWSQFTPTTAQKWSGVFAYITSD